MAVCTITSRSHGNGKTDIGLSNLDMPTKRVSFSHSPTTAITKNVYLLTEVNNNAETGKRKYAVRGSFNNYMGKSLPFFDLLPPLRGQIFIPALSVEKNRY